MAIIRGGRRRCRVTTLALSLNELDFLIYWTKKSITLPGRIMQAGQAHTCDVSESAS